MTTLNLAAVALNQTPLDWVGNKARIIAGALAAQHADIVCFPELCISGYGCEDMFLAPWVRQAAWQSLTELLEAPELNSGGVFLLGLPLEHSGKIFNAVAVLQRGKLLGFTCKKHLANDGLHYEQRWFQSWPVGSQETFTSFTGISYPIGDVWYDFDGITVGLEICHDAWVEDRHARDLATRGVHVICNPSASHFGFGRRAVRERLILDASRDLAPIYVYANMLGCESGRIVYDGDQVIAVEGNIEASGERLVFNDMAITSASVDLGSLKKNAVGFFGARKHPPVRGLPIARRRSIPDDQPSSPHKAHWESLSGEALKREEFARAVSLGLFDYARKSSSQKFALSLSGGADSAACAVLVDLMRRRAQKTLEHDKLSKIFPDLKAQAQNSADLLVCAYQATNNSSNATLKSARDVAAAVGTPLIELDVQPLVENYVKLGEQALGRSTSWERDDLALQNIQSRVRSPSIWFLANLSNALLLTTANRSEAAVGYATMDGDTSGGLAPLGGVDKHFVRSWLVWMETSGPDGIGAYPLLRAVNQLAPSAELRPGGTQTDEGDLMPYEIMAVLERAAVRYYRSPAESLAELNLLFSSRYQSSELSRWVDTFYTLFFRSQWKRERYAPAFHLDDFSLDPKTWLRMPILSGPWKT